MEWLGSGAVILAAALELVVIFIHELGTICSQVGGVRVHALRLALARQYLSDALVRQITSCACCRSVVMCRCRRPEPGDDHDHVERTGQAAEQTDDDARGNAEAAYAARQPRGVRWPGKCCLENCDPFGRRCF